jgi:hypothetical protein
MDAEITEKEIFFAGNTVKRECVFRFFPLASPMIEISAVIEAIAPEPFFVAADETAEEAFNREAQSVLWQATTEKLEELEKLLPE